eukprot:2853806-Rhodomonas_salina.6
MPQIASVECECDALASQQQKRVPRGCFIGSSCLEAGLFHSGFAFNLGGAAQRTRLLCHARSRLHADALE